jgi:uncharacterized protein (TIGR02391 family)
MPRSRIAPFTAEIIEGIAAVLGDTSRGLTGSEIGQRLAEARVPDIDPTITKWKRLYNALVDRQNRDQVGNCVVAFIVSTMKPVRFRNDPAQFSYLQTGLNEVLIHTGMRLNDKGQVAKIKAGAASTLTEAAARAGTIRTELRRRGTHPEVVRYCTDELLAKNNFHALLEAVKSISDRLRAMTGRAGDGAAIVQATLTPGSGPVVAINDGVSSTDRSEQSGFANIVFGLVGMYRNPTAHDPKILRTVTDDELLEALTTLSMVHRRLDHATVSPTQP